MINSYFTLHRQALALSFNQVKQSKLSSLLLIFVIGMAFLLPILLWVLSINAKAITQSWPHSTQLSIFLDNKIPLNETKETLENIRKVPEVEFANYISPEEGLKTLEEQTGLEEVSTLLENNPLPPVIEVHPAVFNEYAINQLVHSVEKIKGVSQVKVDLQWLLRLESIINLAGKSALGLMVLLCFVVILVLGNTLRLAVINRKKEIEVLTLLGATNAYIRRPFLYFGCLYGFLGALLAWIALWGVMISLQKNVNTIATLYYTHFHLSWISWDKGLLLLMLGATLGFIAAYLSVTLQLDKNASEYGF